jgi:hypothetical protein
LRWCECNFVPPNACTCFREQSDKRIEQGDHGTDLLPAILRKSRPDDYRSISADRVFLRWYRYLGRLQREIEASATVKVPVAGSSFHFVLLIKLDRAIHARCLHTLAMPSNTHPSCVHTHSFMVCKYRVQR